MILSALGVAISMAQNLMEYDLFDNCTFDVAYSNRIVPCPLTGFHITISPGKLDIINNSLTPEDEPQACTEAQLETILYIHASDTLAPTGLHDIFSNIVDYLTNKSETYFGVISATCDEVKHNRGTSSFYLQGSIILKRYLCPGEDDDGTSISQARNFLCETHVNDNTRHVTAAEKARISEPYVVGEYAGNGSTTARLITLGFKPSTVIISPQSAPPYIYSSSADELYCYTAFANSSGNAKGLSISSTGFTVTQTASQKVSGVVPRLNHSGVTYLYTAFR